MELFSSGEFPSVVAAQRCSSCTFSFDVGCRSSMIVGCGEAKAMATKQIASRAITKKELAYLLSRLCTVDTTTMQVCSVVNVQVVPPFAEGATLP